MTQRSASCLDCGAPTPGEYCSQCGQKNADYREGMRDIVGEVAQELFQFDSRIAHTIVPFLFQPGKLSAEWSAGRRTRYSSPLRIFLLMSVAYFFALSLQSTKRSGNFDVQIGEGGVSINVVEVPDGGVADAGTGAPDASASEGEGHVDAERSLLWRIRHSRLAADEASTPKERTDRIIAFMLSAAPKVVFVLVPLFALLSYALFFRARRYYVEHLVFAVHVHSFAFVLLLARLLVPSASALALVGLVYFVAALRRFYAQSWLAIAWKGLVLAFVYVIVLALTIAAVAFAAVGLS